MMIRTVMKVLNGSLKVRGKVRGDVEDLEKAQIVFQ